MQEYKELVEKLEKHYMAYTMTGNSNAKIALLLKDAAAAINSLEYERDMLEHQLDIAEREIVRRNENGCQD